MNGKHVFFFVFFSIFFSTYITYMRKYRNICINYIKFINNWNYFNWILKSEKKVWTQKAFNLHNMTVRVLDYDSEDISS